MPYCCQAQPKAQTKGSAVGWDDYNLILYTHPPRQVWKRQNRAQLRKQNLFVYWPSIDVNSFLYGVDFFCQQLYLLMILFNNSANQQDR